jgi:aminoglycoside phosphotransferase (APT) family kinase protein
LTIKVPAMDCVHMTEGLAGVLAACLHRLWGTPVEVTALTQLSGGASREAWDIEADAAGRGTSHLILLRNAADRALALEKNIEVEAAAMIAARTAGVPAPELHDHGDGALGQAYLLMERLDGETIPRRLLRDEAYAQARPGLARRFGEVLARIHLLDPAEIPGLPNVDALGQLKELYQAFAEPRPALEIGLRWLEENQPAPVRDTLVHGDFRTGNLMISSEGLTGVLDWELTHRGDPRQDLGWLCTKAWRFGSPHPVGGFGPRDELMAGYAAGGGTPPDEPTQRWWELYGTVRWGLLCRRQAERYLAEDEPSIELAVLGRRVCEQEWDILLALGHAAPVTVQDPLETAETNPVRPHDRPYGPELLRAVRGFLAADPPAGAGPAGAGPAGAGTADARARFLTRVADNALKIAEREARLGPAHEQHHQTRLATLGVADDAALCAAIRDGSLDDRFAAVTQAVRDMTVDKLTVANPRHLAIPG